MNIQRRWFTNFCAVCIVILIWMAVLLTMGCAGKGLKVDVQTSGEGANAEKRVQLTTDYQIENGFKMERDGDGYKIDLGSATTKDAEVGLMTEMLSMIRMLLGAQQAQPFTADIGDAAYEAGVVEGMRRARND